MITQPLTRALTQPLTRPITAPGIGGGVFDPASLFAGGEQGAWYDPSDMSTLFQDAAGTVTAIGQLVGKMLDKSGNGLHVTSASDAVRPTLQMVNGRYALVGTGTTT